MAKLFSILFALLVVACGNSTLDGTYSSSIIGIAEQKLSITFSPDGTVRVALGDTPLPMETTYELIGDKIKIAGMKRDMIFAILENGDLVGEGMRLKKQSIQSPNKPVPMPVDKSANNAECFSESVINNAIAELRSYEGVPPSVDCEKQVYGAGKLICQSSILKLMDSLDTKAYVYAVENSTKSETNHEKPVVDSAWIGSVRNECKDEACLCAAFKAHTNDSLGALSPYPQ